MKGTKIALKARVSRRAKELSCLLLIVLAVSVLSQLRLAGASYEIMPAATNNASHTGDPSTGYVLNFPPTTDGKFVHQVKILPEQEITDVVLTLTINIPNTAEPISPYEYDEFAFFTCTDTSSWNGSEYGFRFSLKSPAGIGYVYYQNLVTAWPESLPSKFHNVPFRYSVGGTTTLEIKRTDTPNGTCLISFFVNGRLAWICPFQRPPSLCRFVMLAHNWHTEDPQGSNIVVNGLTINGVQQELS